jgi:hypothetical protein
MVRDMMTDQERRFDSKTIALEDKIDARLSSLPSLWQLISIVVGACAGVLTIGLAIFSYAGSRFDSGVQITSSTFEQAHTARASSDEAKKLSEENAKQINSILEILKHLSASSKPN